MADSEILQLSRDGNVALITLNRPQARNALNVELSQAICDAVLAAQDTSCIVITGADPAFTAGLDLRNIGTDSLMDLPPFLAAIRASKIPVIAAVNGPAVTGGFEIALTADFIIASERAAFADTHLRVGVFPGPVLVELPRRVGMAWARQMSLTGNFVDAATALRIGLANEVVPHEQLLPRAMELAHAIAEQDRAMVIAVREDWDICGELPVAEAHQSHMDTITRLGFGGATSKNLAANREAVMARSKVQRGAS